MKQEKHVMMKHSLAKALLDAGVQHFDSGGTTAGGLGGFINDITGGQNNYLANAPQIDMNDSRPDAGTARATANAVYQNQASLAQQILNNQNPSPAQTMLSTSTGNNVANEAALIAGQRGGNSNPGLAAELAARSGGNILQQGAGQGATLAAQEDLAGKGQVANIYNQQAQNQLQQESISEGARAAQNSALTTGVLGAQQINAGTAQNNANSAGSTGGDLLSGVASALTFGIFNKGGRVPHYADGGISSYATPIDPKIVLGVTPTKKTSSGIGSIGSSFGKSIMGMINPSSSAGNATIPGQSASDYTSLGDLPGQDAGSYTNLPDVVGGMPAGAGADGGILDALTGAGGGADLGAALLLSGGGGVDFRGGGNVPGKAEVSGDSPKNDTVPAMLSPGEEVLPRSVTQASDAPERAKKFVQALMDKQGNSDGYAKVLKAKASLKDRVERLEKLCGGGMAA